MLLLIRLPALRNEYLLEGKLKPMPREWEAATRDTMSENDAVANFCGEHFKFGNGDAYRLAKEDVKTRLPMWGRKRSQF